MSVRLAQQIHFLHLLFTANDKQRRALLTTMSDGQVNVISEIIFNLLEKLPLDKNSQKLLKRKPYLKKLATIKTSSTRRRSLLKKYSKQISQILMHFGENILKVAGLS